MEVPAEILLYLYSMQRTRNLIICVASHNVVSKFACSGIFVAFRFVLLHSLFLGPDVIPYGYKVIHMIAFVIIGHVTNWAESNMTRCLPSEFSSFGSAQCT